MNTIQEFITQLVKVESVGNESSFGHYPFQLYVENKDGSKEINAILSGDVMMVYRRFKHYVNAEAKKIFLSVDFPANGDISSDFIAVFSLINGELETLAIPYNPLTGEVSPQLTDSVIMAVIESQFKNSVLNPSR